MLKKFFLPAFVFTMVLLAAESKPALAGHDSPIYCAAERYREAVRDFERHVLRTRYIARCDERLVDDLEDSTSRLRSAARDLGRLDRLFERFAETDALHCRVEAVFFLQSTYPPNPELDACWRPVAHAYHLLVEQMRCLGGHHHGGHVSSFGSARHAHPVRPSPPIVIPAPPAVAPGPFYGNRLGDRARSFPQTGRFPATGRTPATGRIPFPGAATLQRGASEVPFSRRDVSTRDQLRNAILGALLQRR